MENKLSEKESLQIIQDMIARSRKNIAEAAIFFLYWGYVILAAVVIEYILIQLAYEWHYAVWLPAIVAGAIGSFIIGYKQRKKTFKRTHIDRAMIFLWRGFSLLMVVLFLAVFFMQLGWAKTYIGIISLIGVITFISGGILRFKPLVYGGLISWLVAVISILFNWHEHFDTMLILLGVCMLTSYIIPGHMLKRTES